MYLISFICSESCIFIDINIGAPGYRKYVVDVINHREKQMIKLEMAKDGVYTNMSTFSTRYHLNVIKTVSKHPQPISNIFALKQAMTKFII